MKRIEIRIYGLVQGVGFRAYTRRRALDLGLRGFAKNEIDGSVYVVAEGEEDKLMKLLEYVKKGPGRVENVSYTIMEASGEFSDFYIL